MADKWLKEAIGQFISFVKESSLDELEGELIKHNFDMYEDVRDDVEFAGIETEIQPLSIQVAQKIDISYIAAQLTSITDCPTEDIQTPSALEEFTFSMAA